MALRHDLIGVDQGVRAVSWTSKDSLIYALGVGAGVADPLKELQFSTENSEGFPQQMVPTQVVTFVSMPSLEKGDYPRSAALHAGETVEIFRTLPAEGSAQAAARILGFYDKGKDAVGEFEFTFSDLVTGELLARVLRTIFIRGEGGWGGERGTTVPWAAPDRAPDRVIDAWIPPDRALLYRLASDRNPLHVDPIAAVKGGFERPILHGLCTYGFAARMLLAEVFGNDVDRFGSFSGRMAAPVIPGSTITVEAWNEPGETIFLVKVGDRIVVDRGRMTERSAG